MTAGVVAATRVVAGEESDRRQSLNLVERAAKHVEEGSAGLPVGVQVVTRPGRDQLALTLVHARRTLRFIKPNLTNSNYSVCLTRGFPVGFIAINSYGDSRPR